MSEQGTIRTSREAGAQSIHYGRTRVRMGTWGAVPLGVWILKARNADLCTLLAEKMNLRPALAVQCRLTSSLGKTGITKMDMVRSHTAWRAVLSLQLQAIPFALGRCKSSKWEVHERMIPQNGNGCVLYPVHSGSK